MKRTEIREPHYVDMIETWSTVLTGLYIYLVAVIGITSFVADDSESLILCLVAPAFMLGIMWLPGLVVIAFREECYEFVALLKPAYTHPRSIFADGIRGLNRLRIDTVNGAALVAIMVLTGLAVLMSIISIVWDPYAIMVAIYAGGILAWLGAVIIAPRLLYDVVIEKRKMRWVF